AWFPKKAWPTSIWIRYWHLPRTKLFTPLKPVPSNTRQGPGLGQAPNPSSTGHVSPGASDSLSVVSSGSANRAASQQGSTSSNSTPLLRLEGVVKQFPGVRALDGVGFELRPGEVHVLFGENGAGKSTIINIIAGIFTPDEGRYTFAGQDIRGLTPFKASTLQIQAAFTALNL